MTDEQYVELAGSVVSPEELVVPKAKELARLLLADKIAYASLIGCRKADGYDAIVMDLEVELGQTQAIEGQGLEKTERIAVVFGSADDAAPEVLALRKDFPLVPHLNLRNEEIPRSLCLYDEPYDVTKLRWAASPFIERIRTWLARTAKGTLHEQDQSLEPILPRGTTPIVIPADLFDASSVATDTTELVVSLRGTESRPLFHAQRPGSAQLAQGGILIVATTITCEPVHHGIIRRTPRTLAMLHDLVAENGTDLLGLLRKTLISWLGRQEYHDSRLAIILQLPKCRTPGGHPESLDVRVFVTTEHIAEVGEGLGVWKKQDQRLGLCMQPDISLRGAGISVELLNPTPALSRDVAARMNGADSSVPANIVAIGVGAIGSQVFLDLVRAGFGQWTLVDYDQLLPHNMARHALDGWSIGRLKSTSLAETANVTIDGEPVAAALPINVIRPGGTKDELDKAFADADIILDMSASVPVARHLTCDVSSAATRMSVFTNPAGTNLVMLAEGRSRSVPLDML